MVKTTKQLLRESILRTEFKGRNNLYHSTNLGNMIDIIDNNKIIGITKQKVGGNEVNGISLTRDYNYGYNREIQLILDGDKIKNTYGSKLVPIDFFNKHEGSKTKSDPDRRDRVESEEFLISDLYPLDKFLIGFRFIDDDTLINLINNDQEGYELIKGKFNDLPVFDSKFIQFL